MITHFFTINFERMFIEREYMIVSKIIISEANDTGRDHVNPLTGDSNIHDFN